MPTPDTNANTSLQTDSDWPQLLEQWKRAQRPPLLRPLYHTPVGAVVAAAIGTFVALMITMLYSQGASTPSAFGLILLMTFGVCLMSSSIWCDPPLTYAQGTIQQQMNALKDVRATGPLLELLPDAATRRERDVLQTILTRLLPLLRPDDAKLSDAQRKVLYDAITMHTAEHDNAFFLACVEAVAQAGDVNALVPLTRVIVADAPTQAQQIARERARQCRDTLLTHLDFGGMSSISTWLDYLPAHYSDFEGNTIRLDKAAVPMYALSRLLPRLTPADASLLTPRNRQTLTWAHRLVPSLFVSQSGRGGALGVDEAKMGRLGPDFELAVLDALAQIGTGDDASHVASLINDGATTYNRAVKTKAREVLPILEARRAKEEAGRTLLRGAASPAPVANQLLRPAADTSGALTTRPDELLRAQNVPPPSYQPARTVEETDSNTLQAGL